MRNKTICLAPQLNLLDCQTVTLSVELEWELLLFNREKDGKGN